MKPIAIVVCAALLAPAAGPPPAYAAEDWRQWGGPQRNFQVAAPPLSVDWQQQPPAERFRRELRGGHSSVVVAGEWVYVQHGVDGEEWVTCLTLDGDLRWERQYEVGYDSSYESFDGPHSTPLLWEDLVITVAIDATVRAWNRETGDLVWRRDLRAEHGVTLPQSGYAASPLPVGDALLLPGLGGDGPGLSRVEKSDLGVLRLDLRSGATAWARNSFPSSHSSPILIEEPAGIAVFHGMEKLMAIDGTTGAELWQFALRDGAADNVSFTPVWDSKRRQILLSHAYDRYGVQAIGLDARLAAPTRRWSNPKLKVEHGNAVLWNEMLLGPDGSEPAFLAAVHLETGATLWKRRLPKATLLAVDGQGVLVLDEEGLLSFAQPDQDGPRLRSQLQVLDGLSWTPPTLVGRTLLLRSRDELVALRLP